MGDTYSVPEKITDAYVESIWSDTGKRHKVLKYVITKKYQHPELNWSKWISDPSLFYTSEKQDLRLYFNEWGFPLPLKLRDQDQTAYLTQQIQAGQKDEVLRLFIVGWPLPVSALAAYQPLWCSDFVEFAPDAEVFKPFPEFLKARQTSEHITWYFKKGFSYRVEDLTCLRWSSFDDMDAPEDVEALLLHQDATTVHSYVNGATFDLLTARYERVVKLLGSLPNYEYPMKFLMSNLRFVKDPEQLDRFLTVVPHEMDLQVLLGTRYLIWNPEARLFLVIHKHHPMNQDTQLTTLLLERGEFNTLVDFALKGFPVSDWKLVFEKASLPVLVRLFQCREALSLPEEPFANLSVSAEEVLQHPTLAKELPAYKIEAKEMLRVMMKKGWTLAQILEWNAKVPDLDLKRQLIEVALTEKQWDLASEAIDDDDSDLSYDPDQLSECLMSAFKDKYSDMRNYSFPVDSITLFRILDSFPRYELVTKTPSPRYDYY